MFQQFTGLGLITAGNGLTKSGDTLNVGAGTGVTVAADTVSVIYATTQIVDVDKSAEDPGVSNTAARGDHKHDIATAAPVTIGTANAEGSGAWLARADHVHDHGAQTSGTLHAAASGTVAGFESTTQ